MVLCSLLISLTKVEIKEESCFTTVIDGNSCSPVPIAPFIDALGFPAVSVPTVNFDNNQHGENENLRIGHFFRSVGILAAAMRVEP